MQNVILMQKIAPFLYYSQITLPYTWQDSNCYWDGDNIGCLRPAPNGDTPYEERYPLSLPMNVSDAAKTLATFLVPCSLFLVWGENVIIPTPLTYVPELMYYTSGK